LWVIHRGIKPVLVAYAESQSVNIATSIINRAVKEEIGEGLGLNDITLVTQQGNSTLYDFNFQKINEVSNRITNRILNTINSAENEWANWLPEGEGWEFQPNEGIIFKVPVGRITDNAILGSLGPEIPVQFQTVGDIDYDIDIRWEEQAINSTWYEITLRLKIGIRVIVPFMTKMTVIERGIPLASGTIRGEVPQFYSGDRGLQPSFTVPITPED
jgi:sporulation protein YunB